MALFFALRRSAGKEGPSPLRNACVWMLNPGQLNQKSHWGFSYVVTVDDSDKAATVLLNPYLHASAPEASPGVFAQPLAIIPEYVSPRLRAQRGAFVAFADDESALVRKILEDSATSPHAPLARPVVISKEYLASIEQELDMAGVAESTIFPDVGGLCEELARRHARSRL